MKSPKTIKSFLSACITLANAPTYISGMNKLTDDEMRDVSALSVVLQNELGEMEDVLKKFNLQYP